MRVRLIGAVLFVLALLSGCAVAPPGPAAPSLGDRGVVEGAPPDVVLDVDYVEIYRNADHFPNIGRVCIGGIAFATSSTGAGATVGATPFLRVAEWDAFCATKVPGVPAG